MSKDFTEIIFYGHLSKDKLRNKEISSALHMFLPTKSHLMATDNKNDKEWNFNVQLDEESFPWLSMKLKLQAHVQFEPRSQNRTFH